MTPNFRPIRIHFFCVLSLFILSCNSSSRDLNPETPTPVTKREKVIVLDVAYSGLTDLPKDTGGVQKAYPLNPESNAGLGYYAYTPGGYDDNDKEYPLIVFLHGSGERGNSSETPQLLDLVLVHGPSKLIAENSWNPRFPCLVVSPQSEGEWLPEHIHGFIEYLINTYRVNPKRIYVTGLSMGARGCWNYEGTIGHKSYAAALVPICGNGQPGLASQMINAPIWAFHGADDEVVKAFSNGGSFQMVTAVNASNPDFQAKLTIFPGVGHNAWEKTYDNSGIGTGSPDYDPFDMNIYDWMFQYRKE